MQSYAALFQNIAEKLKDNYYHHPFFNGIPNQPEGIDLCYIDAIGRPIGEKCIQQLILNGSIQLQINPDSTAIPTLRNLYFEAKNRAQMTGAHELFLFYPFIITKSKLTALSPQLTPVFCWPMNLRPNPDKLDSWNLSSDNESPCIINPFFSSYLAELDDQQSLNKLQVLLKTYYQTNDFQPFIKFLHDIGELHHLEHEQPENGIIPFPNSSQANIYAEKGAILWAASLGIAPPLNPQLTEFFTNEDNASYFAELEAESGQNLLQSVLPPFPFGYIMPDDSQESILNLGLSGKILHVEGKPGSGKTLNLINIVFNALANQKKCLIISDHTDSLKKIQSTLVDRQLGNLVFLLEHPSQQPTLLLEQLRRNFRQPDNSEQFSLTDFTAEVNEARRQLNRLRNIFKATNINIFGSHNWTETVGKFLASSKKAGKELLSSQLDPAQFLFTFSEYEMLKEDILHSQPLYDKVNTLTHPITSLHPAIFLKFDKKEAEKEVKRLLSDFLEKLKSLQLLYIRTIDQYNRLLSSYYEEHYANLQQKINDLFDLLNDFKIRYPAAYEEAGIVSKGKLQLYSTFSTKHKAIKLLKEKIILLFNDLETEFINTPLFTFKFDKKPAQKKLHEFTKLINIFEQQLEQWRANVHQKMQDEIHRLNSKTANGNLHFSEQIYELEYRLDVLIEELNQSDLFAAPFLNNRLTIIKKQQLIEAIIEQFLNLQQNLRDFSDCYDWQRNWLQLDNLSKNVIVAFTKIRPANWLDAFESWYFHNRLVFSHDMDIPKTNIPLGEYYKIRQSLSSQLADFIQLTWNQKLQSDARLWRRKEKKEFQFIFNGTKNKNLSTHTSIQLLRRFFPILSSGVPVLLATPEIALDLGLTGKSQKGIEFDVCLIDNTNNIPIEQILPLVPVSQHLITFQNTTPFNWIPRETYPAFLEKKGIGRRIILQKQHLKLSNDSQLLLDAIFGVTFYLPDSEQMNAEPHSGFKTSYVNGKYAEDRGTNQAEIDKAIDLLKHIPQTPQLTFPEIFVICLTKEQRNAVLFALLKIKRRLDEFSERILQMERNGLRVFAIEDLSDLRADKVIFLTTFGPINLQNQLTNEIFWLNTIEGLQALEALFTGIGCDMEIIHSLPPAIVKDLAGRWDNPGTALFAKIIQYAEAKVLQDTETKIQILKDIADKRKIQPPYNKTPIFLHEVAQALQPYLENGRIALNIRHNGLVLPMVVKSLHPKGKDIVVFSDGFLYKHGNGAFLWEEQVRNELKNEGFQLLTVFSVNWWKDPEQEARKLAGIIIKMDYQH